MANYSQKKGNQALALPKENLTNPHSAQETKPITQFENRIIVTAFHCHECGSTSPKHCKGGSNICPWR